jgi:hypothetical protein
MVYFGGEGGDFLLRGGLSFLGGGIDLVEVWE